MNPSQMKAEQPFIFIQDIQGWKYRVQTLSAGWMPLTVLRMRYGKDWPQTLKTASLMLPER